MADAGDLKVWRESVRYLLKQWKNNHPDYEPDKLKQIKDIMSKFDKMHIVDRRKYAAQVSGKIFDAVDWRKILHKSLTTRAYIEVLKHDLMQKAMEVLNKDKGVDPSHTYSHKEGDDHNPKFYYVDQFGNYVRYTNGPDGHPDTHAHLGDAQPHMSEPSFESNPEYYTPEGKKLTRCPECEDIEWNPKYNPHDPKNMWAGRWIDPETGEHRYTYIDSDVRNFPQLRLHQTNAVVDTRLPEMRETIKEMFSSDKLKDQITAIMLALLDQGKFRAVELAMLTPADVHIRGNIITLGKRQFVAGPQILNALETLVNHKAPQEPLFSIPVQNVDGETDPMLSRRIGPNYISSVLDYMGLSLLGLQTYHATLRYFRTVQTYLTVHQTGWEIAHRAGVIAALVEWGHDLSTEMNVQEVINVAQAVLIDPVIVAFLQQQAQEQQLDQPASAQLPPIMRTTPYVAVEIAGKTQEEQEFSQWLHSAPVHDYV